MAGIQSCFRKYLILSTSRAINKSGILFQSCRGRHYLVCQLTSSQSRTVFHSIKLYSVNRQLPFRLASTNVTVPKEAASDIPKEGTKTEAVQVNSEPTNVQPENTNAGESALPPAPELELTEPPEMEFISMGLKEPSFESLGLGSWWPSGIIQQIFEYLHINLDLPWWQAIVLVTIVTRILLAPVSISGKKAGIRMMNNLPKIHVLQEKINQAKLRGDFYAVSSYSMELQEFLKSGGLNVMGFFKTTFIQAPIFLSMYYALSGMAAAPVESLKTQGLFWFTDLTLKDPYYILPLVLSSTLLIIIETGAEGNPAKTSSHSTKWIMRIFPAVAFFFTSSCSSCVAWYWTVSNAVTLLQSGMYKIPAVKRVLKIPEIVPLPPSLKEKKNKGFIEGFKEGFEQMKITQQIQDRERMNMIQFQKSGSGPIPRTFSKNPLLGKSK